MTFVRQSDGEHVRIVAGDLIPTVVPSPNPPPTKAYSPQPVQTGKRRGTTAISIPAVISQPAVPPIIGNHALVREFEHQRILTDTQTAAPPQTVDEIFQKSSQPIQTGKNAGTNSVQTGKNAGTQPVQTGKRKYTHPIKIKC